MNSDNVVKSLTVFLFDQFNLFSSVIFYIKTTFDEKGPRSGLNFYTVCTRLSFSKTKKENLFLSHTKGNTDI